MGILLPGVKWKLTVTAVIVFARDQSKISKFVALLEGIESKKIRARNATMQP